MPTVTQRAIMALEQERICSARESLQYLRNPYHFQSFKTYVERFVRDGKLDPGGKLLPDYLADAAAELDPRTTKKQRENFRNRLRAKWGLSDEGDQNFQGIGRELEMRLCFALKLDLEGANDFLRKGCGSYAFNVRSAYEAIYFYCILRERPYSTVLELRRRYRRASPARQAQTPRETQLLQRAFQDTSWESDEDFLNTFLLPNKTNFTKYSNTALRTYGALRTSLCDQIIEGKLDHYERKRGPVREGPDKLFDGLKEAVAALGRSDSAYADCAAALTDWSQAPAVMDRLRRELDKERYARLVNDAVTGNQLLNAVLFYRGEVAAFKPEDSSLRDSAFWHGFPQTQYLNPASVHAGSLPKTEASRKSILLLYFMDYFYELSLGEDYGAFSPQIPRPRFSGAPGGDGPRGPMKTFAEWQYDSFYDSLNDTLLRCNLPVLYPADPFDWLILKSARSLMRLDHAPADPIEYFNEVLKLSLLFDDGLDESDEA